MRKIEKAMCAAVQERRNWKSDNTEVRVKSEKTTVCIDVFLHGNRIYRKVFDTETGFGTTMFSLAGWNTNTTKSRLRALGVDVESKHGGVYYNGKEIDVSKWYNV